MKAKERQKLKHDKYTDTMMTGLNWTREHQALVVGVVAAILLAILAIGWVINSRQEAQKTALAQLYEAQFVAQPAMLTPPPPPPAKDEAAAKKQADEAKAMAETRQKALDDGLRKFEQISVDFPGTAAAARALLEAASLCHANGQLDKAIAYYQRAISEANGREGLVVLARRGLASALESSGKLREAIEVYSSFLGLAGAPGSAEAHWDIGRCHELLNEKDKALEAYGKAVEAGSGTLWAEQAQARIVDLTRPASVLVEPQGSSTTTTVPTSEMTTTGLAGTEGSSATQPAPDSAAPAAPATAGEATTTSVPAAPEAQRADVPGPAATTPEATNVVPATPAEGK